MVDRLADHYGDIEALLDDIVGLASGFDRWEGRGDEYRLEGKDAGFGRPVTGRLLELGYVPTACAGTQLIVSPIQVSLVNE